MTNLVASYTPGANRTDGTGLAWGCAFTYSGASGLVVTQLGCRMGTGNSGNAVISLVSGGATHNNVLDAQVTVALGGTVGNFIYGTCAPFALTNGVTYGLMVSIGSGQNLADTGPATFNQVSASGGIFDCVPGNGSTLNTFGSNNMYAGVDMVFSAGGGAHGGMFFGV